MIRFSSMNTSFKKHAISPLHAHISSKHALQNLLKTNPKYFSTLQIQVPYPSSTHSSTIKKINHKLKKLSHKSKSFKTLDISQCQAALVLSRNRMLALIKAFRRVQEVIISDYSLHKKATRATALWIRFASFLHRFKSIHPYETDWGDYWQSDRHHKIFLRQLTKTTLLQKLELHFFSSFFVPAVFRKLRHIKHLSLLFSPQETKFLFQLHKSFGMADHLESLEFRGVPIQVYGICSILTAIPCPEKITCLAVNINPLQYQECSQFKNALLPFKSLTKLSLKLHQGVKKLGIVLEPLKNFPLENLDLNMHISKEEMSQFGEQLGGLERLRTLRLILQTSLTENDSKFVISVLGSLKGLEQLESIEIEIIPRFVFVSQVLDGVVLCLGDSIGPLRGLKNLSFVFPMTNYKKELEYLMKGLQENGKGIRKLKLDLLQQELEEEGKEELLRFMRGAERLEELDLKGLVISDQSFCEGFKEELRRGRRLKVVRLDTVIVKVGREMYVEMIEEVCKKRGMEEYWGEYSSVEEKRKERKKIEMKEVMARNRWLSKVMVPRSFQEEFKNFKLLNSEKW